MDKYPIEAAGSTVENNPMFRVVFKRPVDPIRLEDAVIKAFKAYPLFQTCVKFDKEYYLKTNEQPIVILKCNEETRPKTFGKNTNDYPWRVFYEGCTMWIEWLHGVSDGMGVLCFLKQILLIYCEYPIETKPLNLFAPGLECYYDEDEKGIDFKVDPAGFNFKHFPVIKRMYKTDCHVLTADTKEIVNLAHICQSSVAPVIAILFSQALRMNIPKKVKKRNVSCNIVLDLRRPLGTDTMHNCVDYKRITYVDEYDKMNFKAIAKEYKKILDKARLTPNVVRAMTERVKTFKMYHIIGKKGFLKFCVKLVGLALKHSDCNFVVTYLGKLTLPKEVYEKLENIDLKAWHDFGECIICALDYNGKFNLNISENFVNKNVVNDFIKLSGDLGIHWKEVECSTFEQAHFEE